MQAEVVTLEQVADVFNGKTPPKREHRNTGHPVLKIKDVTSDGVFTGTFSTYVDAVFVERVPDKHIQSGDILILNAAHNASHVGSKSFFAGKEVEGALATGEWLMIRANNKKVLPDFLYYWTQSTSTRAKIRFLVKGIHLYPKDVKQLEIQLPEFSVQRRIVDILKRADGIRCLRKQAQDTANQLISAVFIDMFGDPSVNPMKWPVYTIGDLGRVQLGRQRTPIYQTGQYSHPYLRVANVFENRIDISDVLTMDFNQKDFEQYQLKYGDILLNEGQSTELVGRPAMWRSEITGCCFQNTLVRFQPDRERMTSEFALAAMLHYYHAGILSRISSKTSNVAHLGAGRFANLKLYCPALDKQITFSKCFERIRSIQYQQASALNVAQDSFQSLLHSVFREGN